MSHIQSLGPYEKETGGPGLVIRPWKQEVGEMQGRATGQGVQVLLEAGKGKERDIPFRASRNTAALPTA